MKSIEEKLWNYIDGACPAEEQKAIELLIAQDEAYRRKYQKLLQLHAEFSAIELDEPPMAFTYNIMESIRAEHALVPLKSAINKNIIRGIGFFFIFIIGAILIYALATIKRHAGQVGAQVATKLTLPDIKNILTGPVIKGFFFFDTVLVLFLLDSYFRKKGLAKAELRVQNTVQQKEQ